VPPPTKFVGTLTGSFKSQGVDDRALPNFYAEYAAARDKPLLIGETSALYLPGKGGASNLAIKKAWWRQVFGEALPRRFPLLRGIVWFEHDKYEQGASNRVDWTATRRPEIRRAFRSDLPQWLRFAEDDGS